jgi:HEAT repeat protein
MKCTALWSGAILLLACASPAQDDEVRRLREELVKARLENLDLKLRLVRLSGKPEDELRILVDALDSPLAELGAAALRELAGLPEERRRSAAPLVLKRAESGSETFRAQAIALFLGRVSTPEAEETLVRAARDPSPAVRRAAASALKTSPAARALETLVGLLEDRDSEVRLAAIDALGTAKREGAVAALAGLIAREADGGVVEKAVDALGAIGSPAAVEPLLALLGRTGRKEVRWSCISSLGKIGDPRAAPLLRPYLDVSRTPEVRLIALAALGKLKDSAAVPAMGSILKGDRDEALRLEAAAAIGLAGGPAAAESLLLPAYLDDASEAVRQGAWSAMLAAAGERPDSNERLARALLERARRAEAEQLCARLHALKPEETALQRLAALEDDVSRASFEAGDFKAALPHARRLADLAPDRRDAVRRVAACLRELKDPEGCAKALRSLEPRLAKGDAEWWSVHLEILAALEAGKDPEPHVDEAALLLAVNPPPHPEERRRLLDQALRAGTLRLIAPLAGKADDARRAALEACRRLGKKIVPVLAAELEAAAGPAGPLVEAGNAAAQTAFDPSLADPAKLKEAAAAWRAWAARN